jgi:hypothetical protein
MYGAQVKEPYPKNKWKQQEIDYYKSHEEQQKRQIKKDKEKYEYLKADTIKAAKKKLIPDPATVEAELRREEELWNS